MYHGFLLELRSAALLGRIVHLPVFRLRHHHRLYCYRLGASQFRWGADAVGSASTLQGRSGRSEGVFISDLGIFVCDRSHRPCCVRGDGHDGNENCVGWPDAGGDEEAASWSRAPSHNLSRATKLWQVVVPGEANSSGRRPAMREITEVMAKVSASLRRYHAHACIPTFRCDEQAGEDGSVHIVFTMPKLEDMIAEWEWVRAPCACVRMII